MLGRDIIIYILQNDLTDIDLLTEDQDLSLVTEDEAAVIYNVGVPTIKAWQELGHLKGVKSNNSLYFLKTVKRRKED